MDLFLLETDRRRATTVLFEQIREAISSGRLRPGDQLLPSRELAEDLGVARATITTVYERLVAEGLVDGRTGAGSFVSSVETRTNPQHRSRKSSPSTLVPRRPIPLPEECTAPASPKFDLRTGRPDPSLFPLTDWRRCVQTAAQFAPPGYGDPAGLVSLRHAIARWTSRSRGVAVHPEQVIVTAGAQQAFDLCARVLLAPGDTAAVEEPGYPPIRRLLELHGARVVGVPVDKEGMIVGDIPAATRLIHVTPSHQAPTGVTMSGARRRELLAFAAARGAAIVEDDYDTEYRWVDRPLEPLHRLDNSGRVIYVGTFSKTLSPSLRVGFMLVPESLVEPMIAVRSAIDVQPPHLVQAALAEFIAGGHYDRHLRRTRRIYRKRREIMCTFLREIYNEGLIDEPVLGDAGLHVTVKLAGDVDEANIHRALATQGVVVGDFKQCWSTTTAPPGLILGFGLLDTVMLTQALEKVRDTLALLAA